MSEIDIFNQKENKSLTMDKIIEKFIPIIGAILLVTGLSYLLYTNIWLSLNESIKLGIGFFTSFAIIGLGFKLEEKLRYFADVVMGIGILLLYGTLIYGSRTSEASASLIPEIASLIVSFIFTFAISFFATARKSKVILILSMLGAYLTPFVIGQNGSWTQSISFNSYLIYFASINILVFQMGKDLSIRNIIPLNILGLFFGTSSFYKLSYTGGITALNNSNFYTSETFSAILFLVLAIFSMWSIIITSKQFEEKDEGYIAFGYLASVFWFMINMGIISGLGSEIKGIFYIFLSVSSFAGWHFLKDVKNRYQHTSLYASGILTLVLAGGNFIPELDKYSSILVAYSSLIFGYLYYIDSNKTERLISYFFLSLIGSLYAVSFISNETEFNSWLAVVSLIPIIFAYFITKKSENSNFKDLSKVYSIFGFVTSVIIILVEFLSYLNLGFFIFYLIPLLILVYIHLNKNISNNNKTLILRFALGWFIYGHIGVFFKLLFSLYPTPIDTHFFTNNGLFSNWTMMEGIFATIISFLGLNTSRKLRDLDGKYHPTFLIVIMAYSSLFLIINYIIFAIVNDLQIVNSGIKAVLATIWWIILAIYMLIVGIKKGYFYRTEKKLGLILVFLTVFKIIIYDMEALSTQNKVMVLMIVGGILLMFSYFVHKKGWLKQEETEISLNEKIANVKLPGITEFIFNVNGDNIFSTKSEKILKVVYFAISKFGKTEYEPGELKGIYDYIINNYKSEFSEENYKMVTDLFKNFVEKGGKIDFK